MKFYEGQKVKITGNTCFHGHEIGEIVELKHVKKSQSGVWRLGSESWAIDQNDCKPVEEE